LACIGQPNAVAAATFCVDQASLCQVCYRPLERLGVAAPFALDRLRDIRRCHAMVDVEGFLLEKRL
jgi:hypothetical protein